MYMLYKRYIIIAVFCCNYSKIVVRERFIAVIVNFRCTTADVLQYFYTVFVPIYNCDNISQRHFIIIENGKNLEQVYLYSRVVYIVFNDKLLLTCKWKTFDNFFTMSCTVENIKAI